MCDSETPVNAACNLTIGRREHAIQKSDESMIKPNVLEP